MNVAVTGATGRMGQTVLETAVEREDVTVAFGIDADVGSGEVAGVRVYQPGELESLLEESRPNVLIDFTVADAAVETVAAAADAAVPAVVGTTGFSEGQVERLRELSERVPVLKAGNFSRGIQSLLLALEDAVAALPGYDVEVTETHHNRKVDAPSGTARMLVDRIEESRGEAEHVHGREGDQPREEGEIGIHARRAGDIRGEHEVLLAGNDEVVKLSHRAESRRVFAEGALDAAVWLAGQRPDFYGFSDVLEVDG
jgi:4-hydroxy-tetrahydrodipicolinate reductase